MASMRGCEQADIIYYFYLVGAVFQSLYTGVFFLNPMGAP
jgi:hypothetical protein